MATVRDIIRKKGGDVFGINPDATVYEALQMMAKHNSGALLIMNGDDMVGILSERDCVRRNGGRPLEHEARLIPRIFLTLRGCAHREENCAP